jgi:hypothetical protein
VVKPKKPRAWKVEVGMKGSKDGRGREVGTTANEKQNGHKRKKRPQKKTREKIPT